jgi:DNA (cytosine-5)-methyltransferase 1
MQSLREVDKMTHIDLFSGIGGFALAARWAGIETVQFVEIDKFCQKVLQKNFPNVRIHGDIRDFHWLASDTSRGRTRKGNESILEERGCDTGGAEVPCAAPSGGLHRSIEPCDDTTRPFLLTGGFPCQPFSCAGKRRGTDDDRHLWPEMLRVIREAKPINIIGENVAGIINMAEFDSELEVDSETDLFGDVTINTVKRGRGILHRIIGQLEEIGYSVQAFVIPACAVNAPHRRDRVWIVGRAIDDPLHNGSYNSIGRINNSNTGTEQAWENKIRFFRETSDHVSDTDTTGLQGHGEYGERASQRTIRQGAWQEPWLEAATRLCRVDARVSNRVDRLKSLGNAIVPQVAFEIMKAIVEVDR